MPKEQGNDGEIEVFEATGIEKFQGFSTKDGEVVAKSGKVAEKVADPLVKAAKTSPVKKDGGDDEGGDENGASDDGDGRTQRHRSATDRINKAVGRQRAAERALDEERRQNAALTARLDAIEARMSAPPIDTGAGKKSKIDPDAPQPGDYELGELDIQYIRDTARYEVKKEIENRTQTAATAQQTAQQQAADREFVKQRDAFLERGLDKYDDFEEVATDGNLRISPVLATLLFESDAGPDILYALADDPKEAKRIAEMSPARQAAWFGRREAELSSGSSDAGDEADEEDDADTGDEPETETPPKTTKAPPPPRQKTRGSGGQQQVSAATPDFAAFERMATGKR